MFLMCPLHPTWLKTSGRLPSSRFHVPLGRLSTFRSAPDVPSLPSPNERNGGGREGTSRARLNGLKRPKGTWISDQGSPGNDLSQKTRVAIFLPFRKGIALRFWRKNGDPVFLAQNVRECAPHMMPCALRTFEAV